MAGGGATRGATKATEKETFVVGIFDIIISVRANNCRSGGNNVAGFSLYGRMGMPRMPDSDSRGIATGPPIQTELKRRKEIK